MPSRRLFIVLLVCSAALRTDGCASLQRDPPAPKAGSRTPHLDALSVYSASLGTSIFGHGSNFPQRDNARLELVFRGTFHREDGQMMPVSTSVDVKVQSGD